ncbi:class I SAM-dependent methyltransferase [Rhodococcoides trifolii]|uniref:class I SAM-dependent methyltransferase n=1 Tax=Rhodococcoides trifolii TaxID=908250 RepID=UPI00166D5782|nr:class I SAM-dependent methyltransferase [Rhodococcus trifolii]
MATRNQPTGRTRWQSERTADESRDYVARFRELEEKNVDTDGEARFLDAVLARESTVLDAGCGTGRVGASLARRGHRVTAVDLDPILVAEARRHDNVEVHEADLSTMDLGDARFDAVIAAGNVMVFLGPGTESAVLQRFHAHLRPSGVLVCGFATDREYTTADYLRDASAAGFVDTQLFSTWNLDPWTADADWAVVVARVPG